MAQDIKSLLKNNQSSEQIQMPEGHDKRFLERLEASFPQATVSKRPWRWQAIAASMVVALGLGYVVFQELKTPETQTVVHTKTAESPTKTLGDVSPDLKKVEDYYLASISYELSKVKVTPENKELFDGYVGRLEELNNEYQKLSDELTKNGPNEFTVNALINNLKMRLNLLYRLKEQLQAFSDHNQKTI
ncbi:MAG: DUF3379 domain-containing protein [Algicola sp.]|nr:DUF3379 domain-containing protein [Algicola sp.]